jgi:uncharacterized protein (TIGR03083 family)
MVAMSDVDVGEWYGMVRERLSKLVVDVPEPAAIPVPACPGWSVHDVIAHLVGVADDVIGGRLTGAPDDEWTAGQVAARRDRSMADLLADWAEVGPPFQEVIGKGRRWPGLLDVLSHEHDIRGAVAAPAGHDAPEVVLAAEFLVSILAPATAMTVRMGAQEMRVGPSDGPDIGLLTSPFEVFRFRMGRRSRGQLAAMEWRGDPTPVLDCLAIFGPAVADVIE